MKEINEAEMRKLFSERLGTLIREKGIQQNHLADILGVSESTVGKWLLEKAMPRMGAIQKLADYFGVSKSYFLEKKDDAEKPAPPRKKYVKIPVLGAVVAGEPIEAIEDIEGYEEIPESLARTGDFFGLRVRGASMEPTLQEGDVIICKSVQTCDTGDIAVVMINGDEATVKEIKRGMDGVTLIGHNVSVFPPKFYSNQEIESLPVRIIGIAYEVRRKFKPYHAEESR